MRATIYACVQKHHGLTALRCNALPPVLGLSVCAVAARFDIVSETEPLTPPYLRGEQWAAPARNIILKRYDEPNILIVTVCIIIALHEFGTCQGGRSWMLAGMAVRMAHALQLHHELEHDPLGKDIDKKGKLTCIDREVRRRTMWACFMMDLLLFLTSECCFALWRSRRSPGSGSARDGWVNS